MFFHSSQDTRRSVQSRLASMSHGLRRRAADESGFSLLELLVVVLIIGALAAIAIPSFAGQKAKATDAQAKELARTAATTAEAVATDNGGSYASIKEPKQLQEAEPTIHIAESKAEAYLSAATGKPSEYTVTAKATSGDEFTITRSATGEMTRTCVSKVTKTGCAGGEKGSW